MFVFTAHTISVLTRVRASPELGGFGEFLLTHSFYRQTKTNTVKCQDLCLVGLLGKLGKLMLHSPIEANMCVL